MSSLEMSNFAAVTEPGRIRLDGFRSAPPAQKVRAAEAFQASTYEAET
jgi:hypothetical protein